MLVPSAPYLSAGDTAWQLTAATLVGLMTVPGMAMLYGGLMPRRMAVNSAFMVLYAFAAVLVVWLLAGYAIGFGSPLHLGPGMLSALVGAPRPVLGALAEIGQARVPLLTGAMPAFRFPNSALIYFQFAFAAITPALLAGAVLGRMGLRAWMLFVPLWSLAVYSVNAFWLWGGGWLSQLGAVDYSGGYVIHVAAGVSGFVAAAAVGARRGGRHPGEAPNNLLLALLGAGILWLGWNGFNGGDPYFANQDAAAAVLNTNLGAAAAMLMWVGLDAWAAKRPTLVGAINGLVAGLVAITPAAGYVNGYGALAVGVAAGLVPWLTMNRLGRLPFLRRVDDTLGVLHTHGVAGAVGGLLTGLFADPAMIVYAATRGGAPVSVAGLLYGDPGRLLAQAVGLLAIVAYDALMTLAVLKVVSLAVPLRMSEGEEELGDALLHGEHAQAPEHDHAALRRAVEAALRGHGIRTEAEAASEG
ncbi:MAG: ammonium transporter [Firmicutes bacterium]|nr:ammonium transporter [Bacillota bacterium]